MKDKALLEETIRQLKELAAKHPVPVICTVQHPRPPGFVVVPPENNGVIIIDYPCFLRRTDE